jgi:hypothetical protein
MVLQEHERLFGRALNEAARMVIEKSKMDPNYQPQTEVERAAIAQLDKIIRGGIQPQQQQPQTAPAAPAAPGTLGSAQGARGPVTPAPAAPQAGAGPVKVASPEEARRLPRGTQFVGPDGILRIVP